MCPLSLYLGQIFQNFGSICVKIKGTVLYTLLEILKNMTCTESDQVEMCSEFISAEFPPRSLFFVLFAMSSGSHRI